MIRHLKSTFKLVSIYIGTNYFQLLSMPLPCGHQFSLNLYTSTPFRCTVITSLAIGKASELLSVAE